MRGIQHQTRSKKKKKILLHHHSWEKPEPVHLGGGPYDIGTGAVYGDTNVAPAALDAFARSSSLFIISFSSWISVQHVQQVARTQSDAMLP